MTDVQALMSKESEQLFNMYKDKVNAEKFGGGGIS